MAVYCACILHGKRSSAVAQAFEFSKQTENPIVPGTSASKLQYSGTNAAAGSAFHNCFPAFVLPVYTVSIGISGVSPVVYCAQF
jgi:hypothetical protein